MEPIQYQPQQPQQPMQPMQSMPPLQQQPAPEPVKRSESGKSILTSNFIIFLVYFVALLMIGGGLMGFLLFILPLHAGLLGIFAIIRIFQGKSEAASMYFATAFLILIVGFGGCFALGMSGLLGF